MADVRITGLHKRYAGGVHAVRGIDLVIPDRQFTVLVGPSGCGKSTLLRTIAGLEEADDGTIEIGGEVVNDMRPRDRDVAMVFQDYALYPHMTVRNNIGFGLKARKFRQAEIEQARGGARQRCSASRRCSTAIRASFRAASASASPSAARSCATRSSSCSTSRSPTSTRSCATRCAVEIKRLHQEIATTMIYVTHDQIEAMTLADRIVLMRDGVIEQQGAPLDLFERPATRFVAGFLGSPQMNFVPCRLREERWWRAGRFEDGRSLPVPPERASLPAGDLIFGVRPEHMSRATPRRAASAGTGGADRHDRPRAADRHAHLRAVQAGRRRGYGRASLAHGR